jgi:RNA-binding protein 39
MDRERERDRRGRDRRSPHSPPRRRRPSPTYEGRPSAPPPPPRELDPVNKLLDEVDSEARSIFVSQLASRLTSHDLGLFFEDKLGRGAVRDARVVHDRVNRRSKG